SSARGACQASIPALGVAAALTSTPYGLALPPAAPCPARPLIAPCSHLPEAFGQAVATTSKGKLLGGGPRHPFWMAQSDYSPIPWIVLVCLLIFATWALVVHFLKL